LYVAAFLGNICAGLMGEYLHMRRGMVVGNWKMNGSLAAIDMLLRDLRAAMADFDSADVAVCPPFAYLPQVAELLQGSNISYGAQNVALEASGAFTGEVAAAMLKDVGCRYVIVGHSERRALYGETSAIVAQKFIQAQGEGLIPIVCVGETLAQREAGQTLAVVSEQLQCVIDAAGIGAFEHAALAYEPVWAIGTGKTASPAQAQEVHAHLREVVASNSAEVAQQLRILYGGSVRADNAAELFAEADLDGALVGGASLVAQDFAVISKAAEF
jgi:triosephosphate isomerase